MLFEVKTANEKVCELLSFCIGFPTDEKIELKLNHYFMSPKHTLYNNEDNSGLIGVEEIGDSKFEIAHIAVQQNKRNQGIGRSLITDLLEMINCGSIVAETDDDAVEFYRNCGFQITNLGEKYPGVKRYHCELDCRKHSN